MSKSLCKSLSQSNLCNLALSKGLPQISEMICDLFDQGSAEKLVFPSNLQGLI